VIYTGNLLLLEQKNPGVYDGKTRNSNRIFTGKSVTKQADGRLTRK
jgi:hypothetical protein